MCSCTLLCVHLPDVTSCQDDIYDAIVVREQPSLQSEKGSLSDEAEALSDNTSLCDGRRPLEIDKTPIFTKEELLGSLWSAGSKHARLAKS